MLKRFRKVNTAAPAGTAIVGEINSVLPMVVGSGANVSLGAVSGVVVEVTHGTSAPLDTVVHPAGSAGATTPSKFSENVAGHGETVGVAEGATVDVAVGVGEGVPLGVGVGLDAPLIVPESRKIWSGAAGSIAQVVALLPQLLQAVAKPPPGFRQAEPELDVVIRSVQPHWPPGVKSILAWTETQ
jgi:hypothetical protein